MSARISTPANVDATGRERLFGQTPALAAGIAHLLIWTLGPALLFGNLHADTLEAAYWGRDLSLGYAKHPPLATWLIDGALRVGAPPVLSLMLLAQAAMAVAAWFVWKTVRLYASARSAGLAVLLFLISPAATIYAVQLNHNALLAPFWAASMYFGLAYLEERRPIHTAGLAIAASLGLMTKYEIAFLLVSLVALAGLVRRFRPAFRAPASYFCIGLFAVIAAPHIWWLEATGWPSAARALGAEKIRDAASLNISGVNAIVGLFTLFIAPGAILFVSMGRRSGPLAARGPDAKLIAQVLAFGPPLVLLAASLATLQIVKPLWVLALASSVAAGLSLLFRAGGVSGGFGERVSAQILISLSALVFAGFTAYLVAAGAVGKPLAAYSADGRALAAEMEKEWAAHSAAPLACVVIADRKIGPTGVLFLKGRPDFVDFSSPSWATPRQIGECRASGAIAALAEPSNALDHFPAACRAGKKRYDLPAMPGMGKSTWPVDIVYIPPEGAGAVCEVPAR